MKLLPLFALALFIGLCGFIMVPGPSPHPAKVNLKFIYDTTAFKAGGDTVGYKTGQQLSWDDFEGKVPAGAQAVANSAVGFKFSSGIIMNDGDDLDITITAASYFIKSRSWVKQQDKNDYILKHEQLHFDIARLASERFRQLMLAKKMTEDNFGEVFNAVYKQVWKEYQLEQQQYDKETNHSIFKEQQAQWDIKTAARLAALPQ
jgi:Bacterial protein of unknown function (DUF922)